LPCNYLSFAHHSPENFVFLQPQNKYKMKTKKYNQKEKPLSKVEEPVATYGTASNICNDTVISNLTPESIDEMSDMDAYYNRLKAEADAKFGVKKRMTVEEYFGKLRYMVNAYYDTLGLYFSH